MTQTNISILNQLIISLCVDDMLILSPNLGTINETKRMLSSNFDLKDIGEEDVTLGIKIIKIKMLKRFGCYDENWS